jgi:chromosome segregation ATPase
MKRGTCGLWTLVVAGCIVSSAGFAAAAGPNRKHARDNANAVRREARELSAEGIALQREVDQLRSDIQKAEQEYSAAKKDRDGIRREIEAAEKSARDAGRELAEITQRLEDEQPRESPFAQAKAAYLAARSAYDAAVAKAESTAEFQEASRAARSAVDPVAAVRALRKQWIDDAPTVAEASAKWRAAKSVYGARRDAMLHKSADWERATKSLAEARRTRDEAVHSSKGAATARREGNAKKELAKVKTDLEAKSALLARVRAAEPHLPRRR